MDCKKAMSLISKYIAGDLEYGQIDELLDHIENCPYCKEELEIYYIIQKGLDDADGEGDFNLKKSIKRHISESRNAVKRINMIRALHCICNTLVITATAVCMLIQLKIWFVGGN